MEGISIKITIKGGVVIVIQSCYIRTPINTRIRGERGKGKEGITKVTKKSGFEIS